jgi:hypothetical protein
MLSHAVFGPNTLINLLAPRVAYLNSCAVKLASETKKHFSLVHKGSFNFVLESEWNRVKNARNCRLWFIGGPQSGILGCPGHFYPASYIIKEKEGAMAFITKVVMSSRCRATVMSKILEGIWV